MEVTITCCKEIDEDKHDIANIDISGLNDLNFHYDKVE